MTPWAAEVLLAVATVNEAPVEPDAAALDGRLREAGTRRPLAEARVLAVPEADEAPLGPVSEDRLLDPAVSQPAWIRTSITDEGGRFRLEGLDARRVRLVVVVPGFARLETIVEVEEAPRRGVVLFVQPDDDSAFRTVVEGRREPEPDQVKSTVLDEEEIRTAPGTQGDPLRAIQNLPGVARTPGGLGVLALRGAAPGQSRVFLGGHPLPRAFHSFAVTSVLPSAAIDRMEFVPSNFGSRYGDATGGVIVLHPAELQRDGVHGHARIDLLGLGATASGPLGKGAYLVAAQRGWVDTVLRGVELVDPTQTFILPRFYDYQAFFEHPVGRRGRIAARVLGAGDRVQNRSFAFTFPPPDEPVVVFEVGSQFHRADLSYRVRQGAWSFWLTPSFRLERNVVRRPQQGISQIRNDVVFSMRAEAERPLSRRARLTIGTDIEVDRYQAGRRQDGNPMQGIPSSEAFIHGTQSALGTYAHAAIDVERWTLVPGLRLGAFTLGSTSRAALDPRLTAHWAFAPRWRWSMGLGLYSQARVQQQSLSGGFLGGIASQLVGQVVLPAGLQALEPRAGFDPLEGGLSVARAAQLSSSFSRELGDFWFFELGAWARLRDDANGVDITEDGGASVVTSTWSTAYGLEALARRRLGPRLWGWVGYTLSRSDSRILDQVGPVDRRDVVPTDFDQRHNLIAILSYRLPRRWRLGGRFRLVSGSPFTDVTGPVWRPGSVPSGVLAARNAARFPTFHQLDVRVDKSWLFDRVELGTYFDVQNVYNRVNPEAYIYDYDFYQRRNAVGLPIFPSLGVRVDY